MIVKINLFLYIVDTSLKINYRNIRVNNEIVYVIKIQNNFIKLFLFNFHVTSNKTSRQMFSTSFSKTKTILKVVKNLAFFRLYNSSQLLLLSYINYLNIHLPISRLNRIYLNPTPGIKYTRGNTRCSVHPE